MAKLLIFVSATIVAILLPLTQAPAAPPAEMPPPPPSQPEDEPAGEPRPLSDDMVVTPAPEVRASQQPPNVRYYSHRQALTFRAGLASDFPKLGFTDSVIGFQYQFPKFLAPKLEAGADLHEDGRGHLHAGTRWIFFQRSYFRPSLKLALDHYVDGKYGLGTLTRHEDWFLRGAAAIEYTVWNPYSIRFESDMMVNFKRTALLLSVGISHGW